MSNEKDLLVVNNLKKYFKTNKGMLHAVDDVSFTIPKGKTLGVVGESGCGKSTLGRTVLRLLEPTAGEVFLDGVDIAALSKSQLRKARLDMQMIFQDPYSSLDGRLSVAELIADPLKVNHLCKSRAEMDEIVDRMMETVGLAPRFKDAYPHELDGGRRQRIGIARALALDPKFIVCDEPVSALDVSIQAQILNILMDLKDQKNLTYIFVTHDMSVVKHISDDIMVMYLGQCVEKASSDELFANPLHPYTKALLSAIPKPKLSARSAKPTLIKGEVSNPIDPKPGCRFAPRCEYACDKCRGCDIPLREVSPNHFVACTLMDE
ncbi:MAG: ABC transporter ATP-binding protein [Ruminococcaceae bacterium]|nr:ABC transporter ATP-binding protein [Oscillospiraceae bacterium]